MAYEGRTRGSTPAVALAESLGSVPVSTSQTPEAKNFSPRDTQNPAHGLHPSHSSASSMYSVSVMERGGDENSTIKHLDAYLYMKK